MSEERRIGGVEGLWEKSRRALELLEAGAEEGVVAEAVELEEEVVRNLGFGKRMSVEVEGDVFSAGLKEI